MTIYYPVEKEKNIGGVGNALIKFKARSIGSIGPRYFRHIDYHEKSQFPQKMDHLHIKYPDALTLKDLQILGKALEAIEAVTVDEISLLIKAFGQARTIESAVKKEPFPTFPLKAGFFTHKSLQQQPMQKYDISPEKEKPANEEFEAILPGCGTHCSIF
ncbi:MAG: hypothetical protein H2069_10215 [Legionella sp.]|nr:hypothetical protein [Legionella sp.]